MSGRLLIGVVVAVEFAVFAGLVLLLQAMGTNSGGFSPVSQLFLLLPLLLGAVLLTGYRVMKAQEEKMAALHTVLVEEKNRNRQLQAQFEATIEKRFFEFQVVNGALNREIAERTQAEEEVRELQKQLHLILDSAGEGILGLDNQGKVTFVNKAACLMLGWEAEELVGNQHHRLIHHTYPDGTPHPKEDCPIYMAYKDGVVHYKSDDVFWTKSGSSFPVEYASTPIRDRGMLTGAVVVFRDMNTYQ